MPSIVIPKAIIARRSANLPSRGFALPHSRIKDALSLLNSEVLTVDEKSMSATAVISTIERDRVGDVVTPEGCRLENYRKNPVCFWGHQQGDGLPIGVAEDPASQLAIVIEPGKRIIGTTYFHDKTLIARQVFLLIVKRIIRATSIGFNPLSEPQRLGEIEGNVYAGFQFDDWELLEFSWVGVPANAGATTTAELDLDEYRDLVTAELSRNKVAGQPIMGPIRKSLEPFRIPQKQWANGFAHLRADADRFPKVRKGLEGIGRKLLQIHKSNEEAKASDDCVSNKIGILIDEGYDQDQAVAIAMNMCSGKRYKAIGSIKTHGGRIIVLREGRKDRRKIIPKR